MSRHSIFRFFKILPLSLLFIACRASLAPTAAHKAQRLDQASVVLVRDRPYRFERPEYGQPTILSLFQIKNTTTDSVSIQFDDSRTLRLTYLDSTTMKQVTWPGRFTNRGFKIIFSNERKEFPPFIPIIFGTYNINRITLALGTNNDLVINNIWNHSGHFLLFGSPYSGSRKSYFTLLGPQ